MLTTGPMGAHHMIGVDLERADAAVVQQDTMDRLVARLGIAPTHIKVDVEGFEDDVLLGGQEILQQRRPVLFLELHNQMLRDRGRKPADLLRWLQGLGYTLAWRGEVVSVQDAIVADLTRLVCTTELDN